MPKKNYIRIGILSISILIFLLSLTQDAFSYQYIKKEVVQGYMLLLMGGLAIFGGGLFEWIVWLANPIALSAIIFFIKETNSIVKVDHILPKPMYKPNFSQWLSLIAVIIAWSFSLWKEVLAAESGSMGKILSLDPGYWLWVTSLTMLATGINTYNILYQK
ncbi:hypothetical protein [Pedobacter sp.]|uniref:hypothetical protein n=1 Tax=Pedobacter sp. TaxID=1411316 RepID=UPI003BA99DD8